MNSPRKTTNSGLDKVISMMAVVGRKADLLCLNIGDGIYIGSK